MFCMKMRVSYEDFTVSDTQASVFCVILEAVDFEMM